MNLNKKTIGIAAAGVILLGLAIYLMSGNSQKGGKEGGRMAGKKVYPGIWFGSRSNDGTLLEPGELAKLDPAAVQKANAEEYRRRAQYPNTSEPIPYWGDIISDPVVNDAKIFPQKYKNPNNPNGPFLYHYLERNNYHPGDTIVIHAYVVDGPSDEKIATDSLVVSLSEYGGAAGKILDTQRMSDSGIKGDKAGDLIYTANFSTNLLKKKPHNYTLIIKYDVPGKELIATNSINFGVLGIEPLKEFRDWTGSGDKGGTSLFIEGKFKITEKGAYHFLGSLYTQSGKPLGVAQNRLELQPGTHSVELSWYGKILCDARESGPYVLKYMIVSNVTQMPGPRSPLMENAHTTSNYKWDTFTCEGYNDPFFLEKALQIENELKEMAQ